MDARVPDWVWLLVVCAGSFFLTWVWVYFWVFLPRHLGMAEEPACPPGPRRTGLDLRRRRE